MSPGCCLESRFLPLCCTAGEMLECLSARAIPKARLVTLESKNHLILSHEPAWPRFIDEISGFLKSDETAHDMS
jgi:hypothetical protein